MARSCSTWTAADVYKRQIALLATVVMAKTIGGVLPMAAKLLHADPAIMAAPLITTIVDAFSLIIYFNAAQALLHL